MKKSAVLIAMILCVLLCACGPREPDGPDGPSTPDNGVTQEPSAPPGGESEKPPGFALTYVPYETVCALSAPAERYRPEVAVFPLINTPTMYKDCVDGPALFADLDGGLVPLPDGVAWYYALYQEDFDGDMNLSRVPQCIILVNQEQKLAVMLFDGAVTTGFDYDLSFDADNDYPHFGIREGYLAVALADGGQGQGQGQSRFGLLDVRTGALVIPCEYDYMELYRGGVYVERGGESMLLDYAGQPAVSFGSRSLHDGVVYMNYPDVGLAGLPGDSFVIVDSTDGTEVYRTWHGGDVLLYTMDGLNMLVKNAHQLGSEITVTDGGGRFLFAAKGDIPTNFWAGENGFVIKHSGMLTAITKRGERSDFKYDAGDDIMNNVWYQNGYIHASLVPDYDYYTEELRVISADGSYTSERTAINSQTGHFRYSDGEDGYQTAYADDDGNIVIPYGLYEELTELESGGWVFVLAYLEWNTSPAAVYDSAGNLLADGLFGVIDELFTPERLVVYLAPDECGFLSWDGEFTPIKNVPKMDKVYYGG